MKFSFLVITLCACAGCSWFSKDEKVKFEIDNPKQDMEISIDVPDGKGKK